MQAAYARGDHQAARALARTLLTSDDAELPHQARNVLIQTEPDRIIDVVALLGLGLVAFLVYNYVL